MRILLQTLELVFYRIALIGLDFGVVLLVVAKGNTTGADVVVKTVDTMTSFYVALPAFIFGAVGLAGGAALTAIGNLRRER